MWGRDSGWRGTGGALGNDRRLRRVGGRASAARHQAEWRALGIATDRPALSRVHDLSPQFDNLQQCSLQVADRQVGQREAVARAAAPLVQSDGRARELCLQALALFGLALGERDAEHPLLEAAAPVEVVRGELN